MLSMRVVLLLRFRSCFGDLMLYRCVGADWIVFRAD